LLRSLSGKMHEVSALGTQPTNAHQLVEREGALAGLEVALDDAPGGFRVPGGPR